jgi:hypothetical protein
MALQNFFYKMKFFKVFAITLIVLTGARGMACENHPHGHQQPSSDSTAEQLKK